MAPREGIAGYVYRQAGTLSEYERLIKEALKTWNPTTIPE